MEKYAYVRVSTKEQNIERQLQALMPHEIPEANIYCDYQSGKDFDRPAYKEMLSKIQKGDLLIIKSIDRLGRNYSDILIEWQNITKEIEAEIMVLDMPLLDTRTKEGGLTGVFIADLVLQIMAYFAQTERDAIRQRQAEGIAIAKAKGVRFGTKPMEMPDGFEDVCKECINGKLSIRKAAAKLEMSHSTFHRYYKIYLKKCNIK